MSGRETKCVEHGRLLWFGLLGFATQATSKVMPERVPICDAEHS